MLLLVVSSMPGRFRPGMPYAWALCAGSVVELRDVIVTVGHARAQGDLTERAEHERLGLVHFFTS